MRWVIACLCCVYAWQVHADLLDTRLADLAKQTHRKAQFTEKFSASYLQKPVISQGRLEYVAPDKLIKTVETPDPVHFSITDNTMTVQRAKKTQSIDLDQQPVIGLGIDALRALLRGDRKALEKRFWLSYKTDDKDPEQWQLLLIPRSDGLLEKVTRVIMQGHGNQLSEIQIDYANGDNVVTRITRNE